MKEKIFNVPNIIILIRILLVPTFLVLFLNEMMQLALILFIMAMFLQILGKVIISNFDKETIITKICDPLADRMLRITALSCFLGAKVLPLWVFLILVVLDVLMYFGYVILTIKNVVVSNQSFILLESVFVFLGIAILFMDKLINPWSLVTIMAGAFMAIFAFAFYALTYSNRLRWFLFKK